MIRHRVLSRRGWLFTRRHYTGVHGWRCPKWWPGMRVASFQRSWLSLLSWKVER